MRSILFYLLFLLSISCFYACSKMVDDPEERMAAFIEFKVEERLANAQRTIMNRCREAVLDEAGEIADSILFEKARLRRDTAARPDRPYRPDMPDIQTLEDSIPVAPLFDSLAKEKQN